MNLNIVGCGYKDILIVHSPFFRGGNEFSMWIEQHIGLLNKEPYVQKQQTGQEDNSNAG